MIWTIFLTTIIAVAIIWLGFHLASRAQRRDRPMATPDPRREQAAAAGQYFADRVNEDVIKQMADPWQEQRADNQQIIGGRHTGKQAARRDFIQRALADGQTVLVVTRDRRWLDDIQHCNLFVQAPDERHHGEVIWRSRDRINWSQIV